ncbi:protein FAR1-RELATED SEQUENCE 5-like [Arachis ipaensis]|uniref:protein FAR1-RELATED SEQUENCE 5-like n=1 Tax=Arachis ipaensis TaxID=130454 RepID=UPI000A2B2C38|nr:protein FAR1-RELATED SEQUENCE 5-like [Arachis ipaensis]
MYQDKIEQEAVNSEDLGKQEFQAMFDGNDFSHQIAFDFYNHYAKSVGFGARKSKTWKNSKGEYVKQLFVCSREGFRPEKYYNIKNRKRKPKSETRCGCLARFVVRFMAYTGRWHVALLVESHNHDCLNPRDMYNEIAKRRRHVLGDAKAALQYLKNKKAEDLCLYYEHIVDAKGVS